MAQVFGANELPRPGWLLSNDDGLLYFDSEGRQRLRINAAGIEWFDEAGRSINYLAAQGLSSLVVKPGKRG